MQTQHAGRGSSASGWPACTQHTVNGEVVPALALGVGEPMRRDQGAPNVLFLRGPDGACADSLFGTVPLRNRVLDSDMANSTGRVAVIEVSLEGQAELPRVTFLRRANSVSL